LGYTPYVFFFSSRRRHTRWSRDCTSVVCSSDLLSKLTPAQAALIAGLAKAPSVYDPYRYATTDPHGKLLVPATAPPVVRRNYIRSEERRVRKECRSRWWRNHLKKKVNGGVRWVG